MKLVIPPYLDTEVKYKKVDPKKIVPKPVILMKDGKGNAVRNLRVVAESHFEQEGKELHSLIGVYKSVEEKGHHLTKPIFEGAPDNLPSDILWVLDKYAYRNVDDAGNPVAAKEIHHFAVVGENAEEQEVSPFEMTQTILIPPENWVPAASLGNFLIESTYELFAVTDKEISKLYDAAQKVWEKDVVGITTFSWGRGFLQYFALVEPILQPDDTFVWRMRLSEAKEEYGYTMKVPQKEAVKPRAPTLNRLPPVQELIVAARR